MITDYPESFHPGMLISPAMKKYMMGVVWGHEYPNDEVEKLYSITLDKDTQREVEKILKAVYRAGSLHKWDRLATNNEALNRVIHQFVSETGRNLQKQVRELQDHNKMLERQNYEMQHLLRMRMY